MWFPAIYLQVSYHGQAAICLQSLVGFTSSFNRERIAAFIRQGVRRGFRPPDLLSIAKLVSSMDDKLFNCIASDEHHVLHLIVLTVYTHSDHEDMNFVSHLSDSLGDIWKIIYLGFEKSQRSVTHDSLRYIITGCVVRRLYWSDCSQPTTIQTASAIDGGDRQVLINDTQHTCITALVIDVDSQLLQSHFIYLYNAC